MHYNTTCFRRHQNVRCRSAVWQSRKGLGTLWRAHEHQVIPLAKMNESENRKMEGKEGKFFLGIFEWVALSCPNLKCVYTQVLIHTLLRHLYCLFDFMRGNLDYVTFFVVERRNILIFLINCCMWSFCSTKGFLVSKHLSTYQKHFIYDLMGAGRSA